MLVVSAVGATGTVWLLVTLDVMYGHKSKKFSNIWLIVNVVLTVIMMIIVAKMEV